MLPNENELNIAIPIWVHRSLLNREYTNKNKLWGFQGKV